MTFEDAVFRARLAYGQMDLTKTAADTTGEKATKPKKEDAGGYPNYAQDKLAPPTEGNPDKGAGQAAPDVVKDEPIPPAVQEAQIAGLQGSVEHLLGQNQNLTNTVNKLWGSTAGMAGGLAVGAGAYGLAGLFPSLRKRRLLRALIAIGAGSAGGWGIGYGVTKGLESGKIQKALGPVADKLYNANNTVKATAADYGNRINNAADALKG